MCTKQVFEGHGVNDENVEGSNNNIVIYVMRLDSTRFEFPQAVWYHGFRKVLLMTFLPLLFPVSNECMRCMVTTAMTVKMSNQRCRTVVTKGHSKRMKVRRRAPRYPIMQNVRAQKSRSRQLVRL